MSVLAANIDFMDIYSILKYIWEKELFYSQLILLDRIRKKVQLPNFAVILIFCGILYVWYETVFMVN